MIPRRRGDNNWHYIKKMKMKRRILREFAQKHNKFAK